MNASWSATYVNWRAAGTHDGLLGLLILGAGVEYILVGANDHHRFVTCLASALLPRVLQLILR